MFLMAVITSEPPVAYGLDAIEAPPLGKSELLRGCPQTRKRRLDTREVAGTPPPQKVTRRSTKRAAEAEVKPEAPNAERLMRMRLMCSETVHGALASIDLEGLHGTTFSMEP